MRNRSVVPDSFFAPLRLLPNPVYRFYQGGALLARFRGEEGVADSDYPEDWLGSITRASNPPEHARHDEGLSLVGSEPHRTRLSDLLAADPRSVAGAEVVRRYGTSTALLVKLLDAAIRLPVHVHPTRRFARRMLGSRFGKAEAWLILATRQVPDLEPPNIRLGFTTDVDRRDLLEVIRRQDSEQLLALLNRVDVRPGDVFFVEPGVPHAIGAGVLLVEVQEPTDYSVVLEWEGYPIRPDEADLGLGWEAAIGSIDLREATAQGRRFAQEPSTLRKEPGIELTDVLGRDCDRYFRAFRVRSSKKSVWPTPGIFAIGVVRSGRLTVSNSLGCEDLDQGDAIAVFAGAPATELGGDGEMLVFAAPFDGKSHLQI